ncbi:MAG: ParA family protein [Deltaproteobacteria bacterium]|nr:ParA family protein [Deltaproteobacteria bacterium]MBW2218941.1 ParA family protein [Deltaproteobacteria bacterium]
MIISFVQTKGGTGKSTLALNTAFSQTMNKKFKSIALVELDSQGTLNNWWIEREEEGRKPGKISFHHISSTQKQVFQSSIHTISAHNELIIMDIPGESTGKLHTRFACAFSDIVIIPMRTSTNDELAFAENLYPIIKTVLKVAPKKRNSFNILPAFTHPQAKIQKIVEYFEDILPNNIRCLNAAYPSRSIYENFNREGMNLKEYAQLVERNKRQALQAMRALNDIEKIAKAVNKIMEN